MPSTWNKTVVGDVLLQVKLYHGFVRDVSYWNRTILWVLELAAEVEIFDVDSGVFGISMVIAAVRDDRELVGLYYGNVGNGGGSGTAVIASVAAEGASSAACLRTCAV